MNDEPALPDSLTLEQAYRAAFLLADQYVALESSPDVGLLLFHQYLRSDPARWGDWQEAVRAAVRVDSAHDPLVENLIRD